MARRPVKPQKVNPELTPQAAEPDAPPDARLPNPADETPDTPHLLTLAPLAIGALLLLAGAFVPDGAAKFPLVATWSTVAGLIAASLAAIGFVGTKVHPRDPNRDWPTMALVASALSGKKMSLTEQAAAAPGGVGPVLVPSGVPLSALTLNR